MKKLLKICSCQTCKNMLKLFNSIKKQNMKNLYCGIWTKTFARFIFQQGGEAHEAPAKAQRGEGKKTDTNPQQQGSAALEGAMHTCDAFSCSLDTEKNPWEQQAEEILDKIQRSPSLKLAFNTFLQEYARISNPQFELNGDLQTDFYNAIDAAGVPNSEVGFNTAWNDILRIAEKGVEESPAKWPYEKLKKAIDSVRQAKTELAQR